MTIQQPTKKPVWEFINSGLGIWFLSTIVIGVFTFCFNEYNHDKKEQEDRETKIKQLDLEIESRISQFWVHLDPIVNHSDTSLELKQGISYDTIKVFWEAFKNPPSYNTNLSSTIYKDYETRSTTSLMIELKTLLEEKYKVNTAPVQASSDKTQKSDFDNVKSYTKEQREMITQIEKIKGAAVFIAANGIFGKSDNPTLKEIWHSFAENIIFDRWYMLFPYTDCLFC
jgi:hypothetical protein